MPPKKVKKVEQVKETPVIFFLRVSDEQRDTILPVGDVPTYSDILNSVEVSANKERFDNDLLKPILEKISSVREYSEHTACFWCCHKFNGIQIVSPISYDAYKNTYVCEGNFCSPECSLAYLYSEHTMSDGTRWIRHSLLNHLYSALYSEGISPAPPRALLRMFGGPLDIEQFRKYISSTNDIIQCELPPIRLLFPSMNIQGPLRDMKKYVSLSNDVVEKASESLRLKRSKPVHINVPTLDMCIQSKH
jgi:hypothetical protein|uniref:MYM-type domain-containing protein n=1 Tax=viral metagenome TaxID=1070528 RepID=A0A6C0CT03_9ZZZZ